MENDKVKYVPEHFGYCQYHRTMQNKELGVSSKRRYSRRFSLIGEMFLNTLIYSKTRSARLFMDGSNSDKTLSSLKDIQLV
ncbi:hypothetical protein NQ317_017766 [Molorchus minor]|uniref:Uncharacterized protein n=1 Tax=Molorchus minor TaxID=1323400 RepID=A0ABQ9JHH3_9CUCU|nr:hypothetical protein NQ317_017766 [Molorchus minor]